MPPDLPPNRIADESVDHDEAVRIIGVELAVRTRHLGEQELEMFSCRHTLHNGEPFARQYGGHPGNGVCVRVTLHTSHGDRTAYLAMQPGGAVNAVPVF
jgi:hypothetical protein